MKTGTARKLRKDHKLFERYSHIEAQIRLLCAEFSEELGFDVGWSDVKELAHGCSVDELKKRKAVINIDFV